MEKLYERIKLLRKEEFLRKKVFSALNCRYISGKYPEGTKGKLFRERAAVIMEKN